MPTKSLIADEICAVRVLLFGRVQGLGVRPALARLAEKLQLCGSVQNTANGVELELEGATEAIRQFMTGMSKCMPAGVAVDRIETLPIENTHRDEFRILDHSEVRTGLAAVPLDRVVCSQCLAEIRNSGDRRYRYPFTSCTACGPRYSIIESMPYDRPATTMRQFPMCARCDEEYRSRQNYRFHAQTNACSECGPLIRLVDGVGSLVKGNDAIKAASSGLCSGRIVALKGLGGYQLLVDATSHEAVSRLRKRKQRKTKPLVVLVGSLEQAEQLAHLSDYERKLLTDLAGPIVVVRRRTSTSLTEGIAPDFQTVGIMLPTTPLHALLCDRVGRPLVCTSGNREGEPLAYEVTESERALARIADLWLHHDRPISRPIDDSVVRVIAGETCLLRMARGYAPYVLPTPQHAINSQIIACGGEQKSSIALWNGAQAVLGPHVGDLTSISVCNRWVDQIQSLSNLYGVQPETAEVVHDRHPDYFSSGWAKQFRSHQAVQHHHAHIVAVMWEHDLLEREVLGLAWDGTGFGEDGTVWGGECLRTTSSSYQRVAWLRPFPLLGGEQAIREPWRIAVSCVHEAMGAEAVLKLDWPEISSTQLHTLLDLTVRPKLSILTSSMGRLFDAVASLVLGITVTGNEGRPAMLLEEACDPHASGTYPFSWNRKTGLIDWCPLIVAILRDLDLGETPGAIAMRFHRGVADLAVSLALAHENLPLVTSGGVFQNAVLGELLSDRLRCRRGGWFYSKYIPPGDGGLAAGQLAIAMARLHGTKKEY